MYGCINFIIDSTTTSTSIYTWHIADSFTAQHIQTRAGNTSSNMSDKTSPAGSTGGGLGVAVQGGKSKNKASPSRARSGSRGHSQSPSPRSRSHSKSRQVKLSTKFRKISQYSLIYIYSYLLVEMKASTGTFTHFFLYITLSQKIIICCFKTLL